MGGSRSARVIEWLTLADLPALVALAVIAALFPASWAAAFYLGGGTVVAPHWFYLPVFLAGLRFGPRGALVAGVVATFVAGPLLPADAATGAPQAISDWVSRGIFFILIGQFVTQLLSAVRSTSMRAASADALRESERRLSSLVRRATDMIVVVGGDGTIKYESPAVERILGWEPGQRQGRPGLDFVHPDDHAKADAARAFVTANPGKSRTLELRQRDASGSWRWAESTVTNMLDEPTVQGIVINQRVVDERKALEVALIHRAFHDTLTGLANRGRLRERLEAALIRRVGVSRPGLLFIDIDDFKTVNDGYGHDTGDRLLIEVASRLGNCVRPEDLVARVGGDEFAVVIEEGSPSGEAAVGVAERILAAMEAPFDLAGHETHIGVSIGIASYEGSMSADADLLLRQADIAMYHAKASGKGPVRRLLRDHGRSGSCPSRSRRRTTSRGRRR